MDLDLHTIQMDVKELPAKAVIVYGDRAEVKRQIELDLSSAGKYSILVKVMFIVFILNQLFQNLSPVIERQSIRVEGRRLVSINQVHYEEQPLTEKTAIHAEVCRFLHVGIFFIFSLIKLSRKKLRRND
jgi:hypothetical protein